MCSSALLISSHSHLDAVMRAIYEGMRSLEAETTKLEGLGMAVRKLTGLLLIFLHLVASMLCYY